jgi:hypothetical protein
VGVKKNSKVAILIFFKERLENQPLGQQVKVFRNFEKRSSDFCQKRLLNRLSFCRNKTK